MGIFGLGFENNIAVFEITTLENMKNMKTPKFETKNTVFGYFWVRISKKLLSYMKSAPSNLPNGKVKKNTNDNKNA